MLVIRPIKEADLDAFVDLIMLSGFGLTTLPKDREILEERVRISERSFNHSVAEKPNGEVYLFAMEEVFTGKFVGVSGLISKIGGYEPFYFYRIHSDVFESKEINIKKEIKSLHLEAQHSGPSEIASLFLHPEYRNAQNGRFLSLSRFLFMAEFPEYFEDEVIAEMRGMVDDEGYSPFFENVGKHFLDIDFKTADLLSMKTKNFVKDLLPNYPILIPLLPQEAQDVIGEVHPNTRPARRILEYEGFEASDLVGVFEPGPILKAQSHKIRSINQSRKMKISEITDEKIESDNFIISNTSKEKFKTTLGGIEVLDNNTIRVNNVTASALKVRLDDEVRFVSLK